MKKFNLFALVAMLGLAITLSSCGGPQTPEAVVKEFNKAINDKNWDKAKDLSTKKTHKLIDMMQGMAEKAPAGDGGTDYETVECKVEAIEKAAEGEEKKDEGAADEGTAELEKATEKATCEACCDKDGKKKTYKLMKIDGAWKVHMGKGDK